MIFKTLLIWSLILLGFTLWKIMFIAYGLYVDREILKNHNSVLQEAFDTLVQGSATQKEVGEAISILTEKSKDIKFLEPIIFVKQTLKNIYKRNIKELQEQGLYEK